MPIATRADLEALAGPRRVAELLASARSPGSDSATQLEQEAAKLAAALQAGDNLISQFLTVPEDDTDPRWETLRQFAIEEAFYKLHEHTQSGASEAMDAAAKMRRVDLSHMRERKQMPGTVESGAGAAGVTVSERPFSRSRMGGFF